MLSQYKQTIKKDTSQKKVCQNKDCIFMGRYQLINNFYPSHNPAMTHHPYCKDCVDKTIDFSNMETVYNVLKVLDTPFIFDEWNDVLKQKKPNPLNEYLRRMNLKKNKDLIYEDSIFEASEDIEIDESLRGIFDEKPKWSDEWQGEYNKSDLDYLNNYYAGLLNDFKIVTTNHKDYAKKIAQASLSQTKAYQKLLRGEDGSDTAYEKATRVFDTLSKSAQFAESQRGSNDVSLGCFGKVFDLVEKNNWVPTYVPDDEDMYDKLLKEFSNINRSL